MSGCSVPKCESTAAVRGHGVCDDCWSRRGRILTQVPALWAELHGHLPPGQRGMSEFVSHSGSGGSRLPVNVAVLDTLLSIPRTLHEWANVCRHQRGYDVVSPDGMRWSRLLCAAVIDLESFDEELHYSESGVEYLVCLFNGFHRMLSLGGLAKLVHRMFAACPECGRRELVRRNGFADVICSRCGSKWSELQYRRLTIVQTHTD